MSEYPNSGAVFEVDQPKKSEKHPDRDGSGEINCQHCGKVNKFWLNGWIKKAKDGRRFLSLSFKPKDAKPQPKQHERFEHERRDIESEIPF